MQPPHASFTVGDYNSTVTAICWVHNISIVPTVPTRTGKTGKMGRHFPVREKSGNFVKTGKVRGFYSKFWKNQKKLYWKTAKNTGKVREICQSEKVETMVSFKFSDFHSNSKIAAIQLGSFTILSQ